MPRPTQIQLRLALKGEACGGGRGRRGRPGVARSTRGGAGRAGCVPRGPERRPFGPRGPGRRLPTPSAAPAAPPANPATTPVGTDVPFGLCSFSRDVSGRAAWKFKGSLGFLAWRRARSPRAAAGAAGAGGVCRSPKGLRAQPLRTGLCACGRANADRSPLR